MRRHAVRLLVAALMAATLGLGVPGAAQAATCAGTRGVSVVVDFNGLGGGGVRAACDLAGAGQSATHQLYDVGHTLEFVRSQPGFICRIDGAPANDPCTNTPPADAYWSLWWSDGKSGTWQYASTSAGSLKVPAGGSVGLSWQGSSTKSPPSATPPRHTSSPSSSSSPSPTTRPSHSPSSRPTASSRPSDGGAQSGATAGSSGPLGPSGSTSPDKGPRATRTAGRRHHVKPSTEPSSASTDSTLAATPLSGVASGGSGGPGGSGTGGGLPGWVAPVAVALLFAGTGAVVLARRRRSGGA